MSVRLLVAVGLALVPLGCKAVPQDPYVRGEHALAAGRLLEALGELDQISPRHPRYAEARAVAQAVERRMRKAQEYVMRGMQLRAQWRDREAIPWFERAQEVWPDVVGAEQMIAATRSRLAMLGKDGHPDPGPGGGGAGDRGADPLAQGALSGESDGTVVATTRTVGEGAPSPTPIGAREEPFPQLAAAPGGGGTPFLDQSEPASEGGIGPLVRNAPEVDRGTHSGREPGMRGYGGASSGFGRTHGAAAEDGKGAGQSPISPGSSEALSRGQVPAVVGGAQGALPSSGTPSAAGASSSGPGDALEAELDGVTQLLEAGQADVAVERLRQMVQRRSKGDAAYRLVQSRLVSVLHQRGLLRYGQGHLAPAIADWREVLALAPEFKPAARFMAAASAELAGR